MTDLRTRLQSALGAGFRVEEEQGVGGLGRAFRTTDLHDGRPLLVAVLPPAVAATLDTERFRAAIADAGRVRHAGLAAPLAADVAGDLAWVTYPFIAGDTLRERLGRGDPLPVNEAIAALSHLTDALAVVHEAGMVHGDVRPECVVLSAGRPVLCEIGLASAIRRAGGGGDATGFAGYAAPEQEQGQAADARSDVYALGVIGYEMLVGFPPFAGPTAAAVVAARLTGMPEPLAALRIETPPAVSAAITRALARDPAARFAGATEFRAALGGHLPLGRRRRWLIAAVAGAAVLVSVALFTRSRTNRPLDPNLLVVAPFDVLAPGQELWHEGLMDVLARNLDGAGPLRTVTPAVAVRRWSGRVDVGPATRLARLTGAGFAIFGRLVAAGPDSVRLQAGLVNAVSATVDAEFDYRAPVDRVERLADSLTVGLLRELGRTRPIGSVPRTTVSAASLPALKAFLQGEQHFRHAAWDSAIYFYERTIESDPAFAPALRRLSLTMGWQRSGDDSLGQSYAYRAGAANHGLSPRESLLVVAESLNAALWAFSDDPAWWPESRRLFATLDEAARRYPDDPEIWYQLGEARYHFGYWHDADPTAALRAFDRAIALDSAFAPAYIHPVELALTLDGPAAARRYATAYEAGPPAGAKGSGIPLVARLLQRPGRRVNLDRLLDTISTDAIHSAWLTLTGWADSAEIATELIRYLIHERRGQIPVSDDTTANNRLLAAQLAYRGHLAAAAAVAGPEMASLAVERALVGALSPDSAALVFWRWVVQGRIAAASGALPWFAVAGDTAALRALQRAATPERLPHQGLRAYLMQRIEAYLALARGDSTVALARFTGLPDSLCGGCQTILAQERLTTAQLLNRSGRSREAARLLAPQLPGLLRPLAVFTVLERARAAEQLGQAEAAVAGYQFVAELWKFADPAYLPYVEEARGAVRRLMAEPRTVTPPAAPDTSPGPPY